MTRLALVMIARDEAGSIARALDSARAHVDRMIVLDTGSADATREIATAAGAEVHTFVWCEDFAAARNAALAHSDADWNLIVDADEWIENGADALPARCREPGRSSRLHRERSSPGPGESRAEAPLRRIMAAGTGAKRIMTESAIPRDSAFVHRNMLYINSLLAQVIGQDSLLNRARHGASP